MFKLAIVKALLPKLPLMLYEEWTEADSTEMHFWEASTLPLMEALPSWLDPVHIDGVRDAL